MLIIVRLANIHVTCRELKRKNGDCLRPYRPCRTREAVIGEGKHVRRKMMGRRVSRSKEDSFSTVHLKNQDE